MWKPSAALTQIWHLLHINMKNRRVSTAIAGTAEWERLELNTLGSKGTVVMWSAIVGTAERELSTLGSKGTVVM